MSCQFVIAWVGTCKKPTKEGKDYCEKHEKEKCSCGGQAVTECSATIGPMVCGRPLCGNCNCNH